MTPEQIKKFEYCKKDIEQIKKWKESLPFKGQNHGRGSQVPAIEYQLERVHSDMYKEVIAALNKAEDIIQKMIEEI